MNVWVSEKLKGLDRAVRDAKKRLAEAINDEFPVGTKVTVFRYRGVRLRGVVAFESTDNCVKVRSTRGKVHHCYHGDVKQADTETATG